jgi:hypothetical protein
MVVNQVREILSGLRDILVLMGEIAPLIGNYEVGVCQYFGRFFLGNDVVPRIVFPHCGLCQ